MLAGLSAFSFSGFHLFGLLSHGVSVTFQADGLFRTFVEAAVVVGAHVLVSRGLLPAMPVGECELIEYKIQIKKKKKKSPTCNQ